MGALVVSYNFMLEYSYRADPLVKKGEERGKIIMIREVRNEGRKGGGEIAYHFKNSFQSEFCYRLNPVSITNNQILICICGHHILKFH